MKKFGKFCLTIASAAAVGVGVFCYVKNIFKNDNVEDDDLEMDFEEYDDEYDDGYDDMYDNMPVDKREYVTLNFGDNSVEVTEDEKKTVEFEESNALIDDVDEEVSVDDVKEQKDDKNE